MGKDTLTVTDNRTGKTIELPIKDGTVKALEIRQLKVSDDDFGLMTYDPAYMNTASCRSAITFIDGDKGILEYRGYPIDQVAESADFLETVYLLMNNALPTRAQLDAFKKEVAAATAPPAQLKAIFAGFPPKAHPMGILTALFGALSTYHPEARNVADAAVRRAQMVRLIAQTPVLAAWAFRASQGLPPVDPKPGLGYAENFLTMMFNERPNPALARAMVVLFILHADHEQNCSTSTMRGTGSSQTDPYTAAAAATAALYGPLHGGANEEVLKMLREIGTLSAIPAFIEEVKGGKGHRLMGFGHRVYKNFDPRAKIIKRMADEVFKVTGRNPLLEIAVELERIALQDDYFVKRKLYPNVDFYSGIIYEAMRIPAEMFTVLFTTGRMPGWLTQWNEMVQDPEQKIMRPRQIYTGARQLAYVPIEKRG